MTRFSRQGFLGENSPKIFKNCKIGVVGLGGGGSHIVQQTAHIGIGNSTFVDPDIVEETNLNRLIGAIWRDIEDKTPKALVAKRLVLNINPEANVIAIEGKWQDSETALQLRECDIIFGCLDSLSDRAELERFCRRFLITYIDIGMDVHHAADEYSIQGQVCLSLPGSHCLWCMGILTKERLAKEAEKYGAAGPRAQVIWPNGILASTAVGLAVQLLTPWHKNPLSSGCWEYDGNSNQITISNKMKVLEGGECSHHKPEEVGDPFWKS